MPRANIRPNGRIFGKKLKQIKKALVEIYTKTPYLPYKEATNILNERFGGVYKDRRTPSVMISNIKKELKIPPKGDPDGAKNFIFKMVEAQGAPAAPISDAAPEVAPKIKNIVKLMKETIQKYNRDNPSSPISEVVVSASGEHRIRSTHEDVLHC